MFLCLDRGVSFKAIDRFDMKFKGAGEPGDDPKAPYHREHRFATRIERLLARELRVDWATYELVLPLIPIDEESSPTARGRV
jgi:hypothetical protein